MNFCTDFNKNRHLLFLWKPITKSQQGRQTNNPKNSNSASKEVKFELKSDVKNQHNQTELPAEAKMYHICTPRPSVSSLHVSSQETQRKPHLAN